MNAIDILILIPALWGFWRGFMKGAIMEAATLVAFFAGVWGGMHFSDWMADQIRSLFDSQSDYIPLISFALVFVGILIGVFAVAKMVERFAENAALGIVNKLLGAGIGMFKFVLVISVVFFVMDAIEKNVEIIPSPVKDKSLLYHPVASVAPLIIPGLKESNLGKMVPEKDDVEVGVDVKVQMKDSTDNK
ncbi:MAG: hypothetical protein Fur0041_06800 [Bacteroidia bacterium]